jgi:hypothetical protein
MVELTHKHRCADGAVNARDCGQYIGRARPGAEVDLLDTNSRRPVGCRASEAWRHALSFAEGYGRYLLDGRSRSLYPTDEDGKLVGIILPFHEWHAATLRIDHWQFSFGGLANMGAAALLRSVAAMR